MVVIGFSILTILIFSTPFAEAQTRTAAPTGVDLYFGSDLGTSNRDNITSDNTPRVDIAGTISAASVEITATRSNPSETKTFTKTPLDGSYSFTFPNDSALSDGTWSISATQQWEDQERSVPSPPLTVIIDTEAPTITVSNPESQTEEATSRTFSAVDDDSEMTTVDVAVQAKSTCASFISGSAVSYTEGSDYVVTGLSNNSKYLCFWSEDVAGNVGRARSDQIQNLAETLNLNRRGITATPDTPDLVAASDSGVDNDNVTNDSTPTFTVSGTINGSTVMVTATKGFNIITGTAIASGTSADVTLPSLSDGTWSVTATQTETGGEEESLPSSPITVTIDTEAPTVTVTNPAQTGEATSRTFSAIDDDSGTTTMNVVVQTGNPCDLFISGPAASYTEDDDYIVTGVNNDKYLCFWSEDVAGNVGNARSDRIQNLVAETFAEAQTQTAPLTGTFLSASSDSGVTGDNITNVNTPSVTMTGTLSGATVSITAARSDSSESRSFSFFSIGGTYTTNFSSPMSDGVWTVSVTQRLPGEAESVPTAPLVFTIDTTAPTVTVTNPESQTEEAASRTFSAADNDSGTTTMKVAVQAENTCASSAPGSAESYTEGDDHVVTGINNNNNKYLCFWSEDVAGNVGSERSDQIQNLIEISATPGTPDLATGSDSGVNNDNITNDFAPTFTVDGTVNGATVTVTATKGFSTVEGIATASGTSTDVIFLLTLSDGIWLVSATQTESGKNESSSSAALTVTIDTEIPTVTVTNPAQTEEATSRTFSAGDDDSGMTTMEMRLQTESTCASPAPESAVSYTEGSDRVVTGLSNNSKYLCFWSEDVAGNVGKARSDQIQNLIEISVTPGTPDLATGSDSGVNNDNITNDSTPTFSVGNTVNGATVTVTATKGGNTVTGDATASGVSTDVTLPTLSDGIWSVSATQTESGGKNESPSSATLTVTIDATAPTVTVTNPTQTGEATSRTFSAGDDDSGTTTMEMRLQTENTCASPAPESAESYTEGSDRVVTGLSNNSKYLCFWSEDVAGNVGKARSNQIQNLIEISATPGTPDLATGSDSGVDNDDITNDSTPTFSVSGTVNGATVTVTATKGGNTVTGDATASGASTDVTFTTPLSDGIWSVSAAQTESGGKNESPSSSSITVTIDATAPTVTVTNPTQTGEATSRTFSAGDDDSGTTTMEMRLQTENTCASPAPESAESYTEGNDYVVNGLSNNSKYLCFWSEDVAGNVGKARSNQIQNLIEISVTPGTPDLATASDSGVNNDNITNDSTPTFSVSGTVNGATVTVTARKGLGNTITGDAIASGASTDVTLPTLSDGIWSVSATQTETGGKNESPSSATLTVTIDATAPTVTVTNPAQTGEATSRTFSAGDNDSGTTTMEMRLQTENTCAASAPESAVSYTEGNDYVVTGLSNNSKYLCFWSEDVAGNVGSKRSNQIQNLTAETSATPGTPNLIPTSDSGVNNDNITNDSTPTFSVSGTVDGATVTVTATKGSSTVEGTAIASGASTNVTLPILSDGIWSVSATQTESGKNESSSSVALTVTIDATVPTVTVANPAQTGGATSRTFSAADDESGTTTMEMRLQTESTCASPAPESAVSYTEGNDYVVTGLSNNSKYLCFWSKDVAGNVGKARSDQIQNLIEISATPGTPDLDTASDSGVDNDNITNDSTPTFTVSGTVNGATVTVTATKGSSTVEGTVTASGVSTNVTLPTLSDGIWSVIATQTESGKNESLLSAALTVTIDTVTPAVTETKFYEDRGLTTEIAPGSYRKQGDSVYAVITFSENVGHVEGNGSSARPYIAHHISADSFYDIVGFNSNPLPDGDCQPNHATERNVYICRYDVESSINDTFTMKVSTDTEDIAGNALASEYIHANTIYLDTTSPDNLVVNSAAGGKKRVTVTVTVDRGNPNIPDEIHLAFSGDCAAFGENGISSSVSVPVGTQTGQSHTFTVSAPKGVYDNCTVRVVDGAGNETSDVTIPSFKVRGSSSGTVGGTRAMSAPRFPGSPTHDALPSDTTVLSQVETITGRTLFSPGQRDDRIRAMQVALNDTSCKVATTGIGSPGNESSYFGERTKGALACYQQQEGLPVTGNYDMATHISLRQNLIRNRFIALFERYDRNIVDFFDERDLDLSVFGLRRSEL